MPRIRIYKRYLIDSLRDSREACAYLNVALEEYEKDHDTEVFLLALRDVAEAHGGLTRLAKKTKLNRQNLYRTLSESGNPRLDTLGVILNGLNLRLSIEQYGSTRN